jgi:lysophospholipase L1-like esterase
MQNERRLFGSFLLVLVLAGCSTARTKSPNSPETIFASPTNALTAFAPIPLSEKLDLEFIPASKNCFSYEGRFDKTDPAGPVVVWQASRIDVGFSGGQLVLRFDHVHGQNFFDAQLDGIKYILSIRGSEDQHVRFQLPLNSRRHQLSLFKRSEASAGTVQFKGIEISKGAKAWRFESVAYRVKMEFVGDSITAGACDEDGDTDQWDDRRTHNAMKSYAALTAQAFSADYRNISVSGMGIVRGWVDKRAIQIWDRLYPDTNSPAAELSSWKPDVILVNLGENDDSFSNAKGLPFPENYADEYAVLIRAIRKAHSEAEIVLLRGGMYGGSQSPALRQAWGRAVSQLESEDSRMTHFVFTHWSRNHPRVSDHQAMADELAAWLKQQEFMRPYGPFR